MKAETLEISFQEILSNNKKRTFKLYNEIKMLKPYQKVVGYSPNKYLFKKHSHLQRYYFLKKAEGLISFQEIQSNNKKTIPII